MRTALAAAVVAACALVPASASAGELYIHGYDPNAQLNGLSDAVVYEGYGTEQNTVSASSHFDGHVVNVYDKSAEITTISGPAAGSDGQGKYPCQIIDPHHGRCILPQPASDADHVACLPECPPAFTAEGAQSIVARLGNGDDSFYAIDGSDPFNAAVDGGAGDDWVNIHENVIATVSLGAGTNIVSVGSHSIPDWSGITGGDGPDEIHARNGSADGIWCGGDVDTVIADESDYVADNCEIVDRG